MTTWALVVQGIAALVRLDGRRRLLAMCIG